MKSVSRQKLHWIAAVVITLLTSDLHADENAGIRFSFDPGDQTRFVQNTTTRKEKEIPGKDTLIDETTTTTKITLTQTENGWDLLAEPQSMSISRNGQKINNPILNLLSSAVITYKIDSNGKLTEIHGYEAFINGLSKQMPPQLFKKLTPVLNIDAMKAKEFAEWNGRIGDYVGAVVNLGDRFKSTVPFELPNGSTIDYHVTTNITRMEPCADTECVRIDQEYDTLADNAAKMAGEVFDEIVNDADGKSTKSNSEENTATIKGSVTRLIDPSTMLIYGEESIRIFTLQMDVPGEGPVPMKMKETRVYEFIY